MKVCCCGESSVERLNTFNLGKMKSDQLPKPAFYFKGFPEDVRFERHAVPDSLEIAKGTLYEAWYRCLKYSPYLANAIDTGVWQSEKLRTTYELFGDLRGSTFDEWWVDVGFNLFCEGKNFRRISVPDETEDVPENTIRFDVPLNVSPATLKAQFNLLLKKHHPHYRQFDRWKQSTAKAKMRTSKLSSPAINLYLQAYEVQQELRKTNPNVKLYEIGEAMNANPNYLEKNGDLPSDVLRKHEKMSLQITEYIEKARDLIANASEGVFPSTETHAWVERNQRGASWRRS